MDCFKYILIGVNGNSDLPAILLGIVVAYLTILISVAIAIFIEKKEFEALDRNVILDHIIKAKYLLLYLGFSTIPLLFWNGSLLWTRVIEIFLWSIGIFCFTKILIEAYHWMKGNKFRLRFDYLQRLTDKRDLEETWRSVWQTEKINLQNEQEFFSIFHDTLNILFAKKNEDLVIASKLLGDFNNFIDKRDDAFFIWTETTLDSVLEWHFGLWKKQNENVNQKERAKGNLSYYNLLRTISSIFQKIEIKALEGRMSYTFFERFKNHVENHKTEQVLSQSYPKNLLNSFYEIFFQNIYDAPEKFDIWEHYFPDEWKITKTNLQGTENLISRISLDIFIKWAIRRIGQSSKEIDNPLDDISKNLFPEVDPILWARLLIFLFSPYGENRVRSVIERRWTFGFYGRVKVYRHGGSNGDDLKKMVDAEVNNTFDLFYLIFKRELSKTALEENIESLKQLSYSEGSDEANNKRELNYLFTKMLDYIKKPDLSDSIK